VHDTIKYLISGLSFFTALTLYHIGSTYINRSTSRFLDDYINETKDYLELKKRNTTINLEPVLQLKKKYAQNPSFVFPNFDYFKIKRKQKELSNLLAQV
jgi:hypothetical protein